jgi:hypothetical protein
MFGRAEFVSLTWLRPADTEPERPAAAVCDDAARAVAVDIAANVARAAINPTIILRAFFILFLSSCIFLPRHGRLLRRQ